MSGMSSIRKAIFRPIYGPIKEKLDTDYAKKRRNERELDKTVKNHASELSKRGVESCPQILLSSKNEISERFAVYKKEYKDAVDARKKSREENAQRKTASEEANRLINALNKKFTRFEAEKSKSLNQILKYAKRKNLEDYVDIGKIESRSNSLNNSPVNNLESNQKLDLGEYHPASKNLINENYKKSLTNEPRIISNVDDLIQNLKQSLSLSLITLNEDFKKLIIDVLIHTEGENFTANKKNVEDKLQLCLDIAMNYAYTLTQMQGAQNCKAEKNEIAYKFDDCLVFLKGLRHIQESVKNKFGYDLKNKVINTKTNKEIRHLLKNLNKQNLAKHSESENLEEDFFREEIHNEHDDVQLKNKKSNSGNLINRRQKNDFENKLNYQYKNQLKSNQFLDHNEENNLSSIEESNENISFEEEDSPKDNIVDNKHRQVISQHIMNMKYINGRVYQKTSGELQNK